MEVCHLCDAHSFDKTECDGRLSTAAFDTDVGTSEWGKPSSIAKVAVVRLAKDDGTTTSLPQLNHSVHRPTFVHESQYLYKNGKQVLNYEDFPDEFSTASIQFDQVDNYGQVPDRAELVGY